MIFVLFFILGLVFGSFFNVVIYRLPKKESLLNPPSHCPSCNSLIKWYDNIPLISFAILKGRCRSCSAKISWQYPLVELLSGSIFLYSYLKFGFQPLLFISLFFLSILLVGTFIDLDTLLIPNRLIFPSIGLSLIFWIISSLTGFKFLPLVEGNLMSALLGALLGGMILLLIAWLSPFIFGREGMGGGDVKLAFFIGFYLGFYVLVAFFLAFLLGSLFGLFLIVLKGWQSHREIPFGPFLSLGAFLTLLFGQPLAHWYLSLLS
jgi:leader peptidase (prepilin peptidase)/N-methyltransferase